jgi:hypothetical protein
MLGDLFELFFGAFICCHFWCICSKAFFSTLVELKMDQKSIPEDRQKFDQNNKKKATYFNKPVFNKSGSYPG